MSLENIAGGIKAVDSQLQAISASLELLLLRRDPPATRKSSGPRLAPDDTPRWAQDLTKALDHVSACLQELSTNVSSNRMTLEQDKSHADHATRSGQARGEHDATHSDRDDRSDEREGRAALQLARVPPTSAGGASEVASTDEGPGTGVFCLNANDLGASLIPRITRFSKEQKFGKIPVMGVVKTDWVALTRAIQPPKDHDLVQVEHASDSRGDGISVLRLSRCREFKLPDFSQAVQAPLQALSQASFEQFLEQIIHHPPPGRIPYYVGPASAFNGLLHPGAELLAPRLGQLSGINEHWCHAGDAGSGTAFHREDAEFRSCNLTLAGWKLWLLVRPAHTEKLEAFFKRLGGCTVSDHCDQFVRHQTLLVTPARLRCEGIEYDICLTGPGEMMITAPRQYHYVVNMTACIAVAVNFLLPGETAIPAGLTVCKECGLFPLREKFPEIRLITGSSGNPESKSKKAPITRQIPQFKQRKRVLPPASGDGAPSKRLSASAGHSDKIISRKAVPNTRIRRAGTTPQEDSPVSVWLAYLQRHDPCYRPPNRQEAKLGSKLLRVFYACRSRSAVESLVDIVESWRRHEPNEWDLLANYRAKSQHFGELARLISRLEHKRRLNALLSVLLKIELANYVDEKCAREKLYADDWAKVRAGMSLPDGKQEDGVHPNRKLAEWRDLGRKMRRFPLGVLCLAPVVKARPHHVNHSTIASLSDQEVDLLVKVLELDRRGGHFLHLGSALAETIFRGSDIPEFRWEKHSVSYLTTVPDEEELLRWMVPFPCPPRCVYDPAHFRATAKPEYWPGDWPANPTTGSGFDSQCDFCTSGSCMCTGPTSTRAALEDHYYPSIQHGHGCAGLVLRASGAKGQGIFVKGPRGHVIFKKGHPLGEFIGQIVPPGSYTGIPSGGMALDVEREDLPGAPVVYQIYCGEVGNWTRKINHQCKKPSAFLRSGMLSGRHSVLVFANRDLKSGDEVTIRYSAGRQAFECQCEDCQVEA